MKTKIFKSAISDVETIIKHALIKLFPAKSNKIGPGEIKLSEYKNIIVVRQHDPMGDILLSTAVIPNIKMALPEAKIDVVTRPELNEKDIFTGNTYINNIIVFSKRKLIFLPYIIIFLKQIRKVKYDLAIVPGSTSVSFFSLLIAYFSKAPVRVGYDGQYFKRKHYTEKFLTTEVPYDGSAKKHQVERNLDILRYIGIPIKTEEHYMATLKEEDEWAKANYKENNVNFPGLVIGIHPGANRIDNRWAVEKFIKISEYFVQKHKAKIVLFSGPKERDLAEVFTKQSKFPVFATPLLTLRQFASMVKPLSLFICNDTGVLHVAAALGTPTLAVFGPTDPLLWNPLGENHSVVRDKSCLVENVNPETVIKEAERALKIG